MKEYIFSELKNKKIHTCSVIAYSSLEARDWAKYYTYFRCWGNNKNKTEYSLDRDFNRVNENNEIIKNVYDIDFKSKHRRYFANNKLWDIYNAKTICKKTS